MDSRCKYLIVILLLMLGPVFLPSSRAQFLMDMVDTTKEMGKGVLSLYRRFDQLRLGGYIQPQFQAASGRGAVGYSGGNFSEFSNNRFTLRRGRIRFDFVRYSRKEQPNLQFVFQFDGTERGVAIRDFWGRYWEDRWRLFHFTTGMFARPFGFEVNLSSGDRESPERGRMSQILMRTERDLGAMASFEPVSAKGWHRYLKVDAGIFNGQGLTGPVEFDAHKDFVGQFVVKPVRLGADVQVGGGVSILRGGLRQTATASYHLQPMTGGAYGFFADSARSGPSTILPRRYHGVNAQLKRNHTTSPTELRLEHWWGRQTAYAHTSETPGFITTGQDGRPLPFHVRPFSGGFLTLLQHLGSMRHQAGVKFDWYDPNTLVTGEEVGKPGAALHAADVRYSTLGAGYIHHVNENMKLTLWYERVWNEKTLLSGLQADLDDDVLTLRVQFRF